MAGSKPMGVVRGILSASGTGVLLVVVGCSVLRDAHHTVSDEFCYEVTNKAVHKRMVRWADAALMSYESKRRHCLSVHFARGFRAGYVRYLQTGLPGGPAFPPEHYMKVRYTSRHGHKCIEQWTKGFSAGGQAAAESGHRELVKVPFLSAELAPIGPKLADGSQGWPSTMWDGTSPLINGVKHMNVEPSDPEPTSCTASFSESEEAADPFVRILRKAPRPLSKVE